MNRLYSYTVESIDRNTDVLFSSFIRQVARSAGAQRIVDFLFVRDVVLAAQTMTRVDLHYILV